MITITEINPVYSKISDPKVISDLLSYQHEYWQQGKYKKHRHTVKRSMVSKGGVFLTGFVQQVLEFLKYKEIEHCVERPADYGIKVGKPKLDGITFRSDQQQALNEMLAAGRGVWQAPTGSGKTLLCCGLVAAYQTTALVMVHTEQLFVQALEELERFFPGEVGQVGRGVEEPASITVGMTQTVSRREFDPDAWGLVIWDECHHCNKIDGMAAKILTRSLAPHRFGFTATLPTTKGGRMAMEGLLGRQIGRTEYDELQQNGVLAKPRVRIRLTPEAERFRTMKGRYDKVYTAGIVEYRTRNVLVMEEARQLLDKDLTVLVMVEQIAHGKNLMKIAKVVCPGAFVFLHGETADEIKAEEKKAFSSKKRRGVIATRIWGEGVNIKSVGAVINAVGGESEISTIQRFGRGLRRADGKDSVMLVDFFDRHHKHFLRHSGKRICTYIEWGWLGAE